MARFYACGCCVSWAIGGLLLLISLFLPKPPAILGHIMVWCFLWPLVYPVWVLLTTPTGAASLRAMKGRRKPTVHEIDMYYDDWPGVVDDDESPW